MQGLRTKLDVTRRNIGLLLPSPDIVVLTETWLHAGITDAELGLHNYLVFRRDRYDVVNAKYGGGVLIAVKNHLNAKLIVTSSEIEEIFVEISGLTKNLIIGGFYTPSIETEVYIKHFKTVDKLIDLYREHEFMIMGDYNLRETLWSNHNDVSDNLLASCYSSNTLIRDNAVSLMNFFSYFGMSQYYPVHQAKGYTLDLAFSTLKENDVRLVNSLDSLVPLVPHHNQAFFEIASKHECNINRIESKLNFCKADYIVINNKLSSLNWEEIFVENSVENNVAKFYSILNKLIFEHVPLKKEIPSTYPIWYSNTLISNIVGKKKIHKRWLQFGVFADYTEFKKLRSMCIRQSINDRREYIEKIESKSNKNIKHFWNYVSTLSKSNGIPQEMFLNETKSNSNIGACNLFAKNFELVYLQSNLSFSHQLLLNNELDFTIGVKEIEAAINNLKESNNVGPDGLSAYFVKSCMNTIVKPLYLLYNQSLVLGHMPKLWKKTFVTPVFKAGNKNDVLNYRPIAIIGTISKIFDSIVANNLAEICMLFIVDSQHGFVKGRSTLTNLLFYNSFISETLNDSKQSDEVKQVDSIYLDFSKAFDSVNHDLLIYKLSKFGLSGGTLNWIYSYLSGRELLVRIKGNFSDSFVATSGVPQGSHLGPLLFVLFINDVGNTLKFATILIFADDIKIFARIKNFYDQVCLQKDLDAIYEWSCLSQLRLNCSKCKVLSFIRSGTELQFQYTVASRPLETVERIKDLGVIFQSNFEFDTHLNAVTSKAFQLLGFLKRSTREFRSYSSIIHLYKTLIRPVLLYGSIIWSPSKITHITVLESVQHKFFRYIAYKMGRSLSYDEHDYSELAVSLGLESVKSLHIYHDLLFVRKVTLNLINSECIMNLFVKRDVPYELRLVREMREMNTNKNFIYYSSVPRLRRKWNKIVIPSDIYCIGNLGVFKKKLKELVNRYC